MHSNIIDEFEEEDKENSEDCFINSLYNHELVIHNLNKLPLTSNTFTFIDRNRHQLIRYMRKNPYKLLNIHYYIY